MAVYPLIGCTCSHPSNDVNASSNAYSFNPYYAGMLIITPKLPTSFRLHYLWNSENDNPNPLVGADDFQPCDAFHMNYAALYQITPSLRLSGANTAAIKHHNNFTGKRVKIRQCKFLNNIVERVPQAYLSVA